MHPFRASGALVFFLFAVLLNPWAKDIQPLKSSGKGAPAAVEERPYRVFPTLLTTGKTAKLPDTVQEENDNGPLPANIAARIPIIANNQILAFYGKPEARQMGILGEYSKEDLAQILAGYVKLFDDANGPQGVIPAYYLIYGTCWPKGEIGFLRNSVVEEYIQYAADHGMLVFVDHQIGKYTVGEAMGRILPFLKYPNVHLALDPEWRTLNPMKEIGSITAEELNAAQKQMQDYIIANDIPGVRILVVHQFQDRMIAGREKVKADFDRILLIHTADGFGSPSLKKSTYRINARATNMPLKGFKLFFKTTVPGAGYDQPLMLPSEVLELDPQPVLIMYQ